MPSHADGQRAGAPRRTSGWPRGQSPSSNRVRPHPKKAGQRERRNPASAAAKEKPSIPPKVRSPKNLATGRAILLFCPSPAAKEGGLAAGRAYPSVPAALGTPVRKGYCPSGTTSRLLAATSNCCRCLSLRLLRAPPPLALPFAGLCWTGHTAELGSTTASSSSSSAGGLSEPVGISTLICLSNLGRCGEEAPSESDSSCRISRKC